MPEQQIDLTSPPSFDLPGSVFGVASVIAKPEDIVSITWDNLKLIKPEWLDNEDLVYEFNLLVQATCDGNEISEISYLLTTLHALIQQNPNLADQRPDLFLDYLEMLAVLKASLLSTFTDNEVADFLKENSLLTLKVLDFDLKDRLNELFVLAQGFPIRIDDLSKQFTRAIEDNGEVLGTEPIVFKDDDEPRMPSLRNWITDYNQSAGAFTRPGTIIKRGGTERAAYITQNENVRHLSQDERAILLRLLEIYDWLRFGEKPLPIAGAAISAQKILPKTEARTLPVVPRPPVKLEVPVKPPAIPPPPRPFSRIEPIPPRVSAPPPLSPAELKREILTPELPKHEERAVLRSPILPTIQPSVIRPPAAIRPPVVTRPATPAAVREVMAPVRAVFNTLDDIRYVDDLKKIEVKHLRQAELRQQTAKLKSKITYLALANRLFTHQTINVFEQSPLFKTYLAIGETLIANTIPDRKTAYEETISKIKTSGREMLTLQEFEAIADLKKELEKM
jgi:hypothetical protein